MTNWNHKVERTYEKNLAERRRAVESNRRDAVAGALQDLRDGPRATHFDEIADQLIDLLERRGYTVAKMKP